MKQAATYHVNMRAGLATVAGDDATREKLEAEVRSARASLRGGQVVVAPRCRVRTTRGMLNAGALVGPTDIADSFDADGELVERGPIIFRRLIERGELIEAW